MANNFYRRTRWNQSPASPPRVTRDLVKFSRLLPVSSWRIRKKTTNRRAITEWSFHSLYARIGFLCRSHLCYMLKPQGDEWGGQRRGGNGVLFANVQRYSIEKKANLRVLYSFFRYFVHDIRKSQMGQLLILIHIGSCSRTAHSNGHLAWFHWSGSKIMTCSKSTTPRSCLNG